MKKLLNYSLIFSILFTLYGCPVGLDYPMGTAGEELIDTNLIGTWTNHKEDSEVKTFRLSIKDEFSYQVEVLEKGSAYMLSTNILTGWVSRLKGKTFLYFKPSNEEYYYHIMINEFDKDYMQTCDVSLLDGGMETVTSSEKLREQINNSMKLEGFCNESTDWIKE